MSDNDYEVIKREDRPDLRARIVYQYYPDAPECDATFPVLRFDRGSFSGTAQADKIVYGDPGDDLSAAFDYFGSGERTYRADGLDVFERYVRIFHGGSVNVLTRGNDREYGYLAYGTVKLARDWGCDDELATKAESPEWQAYLDGQVFGIVIEQAMIKETTRFNYNGQQVSFERTLHDWIEIESVWGFYGDPSDEDSNIMAEAKSMLESTSTD